MKTVCKKLLSILTAVSIICSAAAAAVGTAETSLPYINKFDTAQSINDLELVGGGVLGGKPTMAFSGEKGCMYFEAWGQNTGFLLPESVSAANFIAEADFVYEKKSDYRDRPIGFGMIFDYQDNNNFADVVYYPLNGNVIMHNAISASYKGRNAEKGNGASFTANDNEEVHLKLMVNEGKMEFLINDELCYSYYSDGSDSNFRNFKEAGRIGLFFNADKTMLTVKNLIVREVKESDKAYYSNAYMGQTEDSLKPLSEMSSYFKPGRVDGGTWGTLGYYGDNYNQVGRYINIPLEGNYTVDMNFAFKNPLNASRYIGFALGFEEEADGGHTYILAAVRENGQMMIEQKTITGGTTPVESGIGGSEAAYGSCADTLPEGKKNPDVNMNAAETERYLLSYIPKDYTSSGFADVQARRHNLHMEVTDGKVSLTFEGKTIECTPDVNTTDGYLAIRSTGTDAAIYSLRAAPYVGEIKTTIEKDYGEIGTSSTIADIKINDEENIVTPDSVVILAVYKNGVLIATDIKKASEKNSYGIVSMEAAYSTESDDTEGITAKAMLWNGTNIMIPLTESVNI